MKKTLTICCLVLFANLFAIAQRGNYDKRLTSKFSQKQLNEMRTNNIEEYNYWNFYVANAYRIIDAPKGKENVSEIGGTLVIKDVNNINVFDLKLIDGFYYYKIAGSDKLLNVFTENQIKEKYNQSKTK